MRAFMMLLLVACDSTIVDESMCRPQCDDGEICIQDTIDGPWICVEDP